MPTTHSLLVLSDVSKTFGEVVALIGVSLSVSAGEIVVLLGPSGCGKTTLLRIIAGLEQPDAGSLTWQGNPLTGVPIHQRGFGMVFQDYALFPHKNVAQNVVFGLRMQNWTRDAVESRLAEVLALVGLTGFEHRTIDALSGGEQQRVALARALAPAPRLLLLDEPLGALDRALRERLMIDLRNILKKAGGPAGAMTAVYVTHDQAEAFAIADRVAVMSTGNIVQTAPPKTLYRRPATPTVARFLGMENLLPVEEVTGDHGRVQTPLGALEIDTDVSQAVDRHRLVLIRPDAARLTLPGSEASNPLVGRLRDVSFRGRFVVIIVETDQGVRLKLELDQAVELPPAGELLHFSLDPSGIQLMPGS